MNKWIDGTISALDGNEYFEDFKRSGYDSEWLAKFVKEYPVAFLLSWVKNTMAGLAVHGNWDSIKMMAPGSGERKNEQALKKYYIDFLIFQGVYRLLSQGVALTGHNGALEQLSQTSILGSSYGVEQLKTRYYRFKKHKPAKFIDQGRRMICGPTMIEIKVSGKRIQLIGFWGLNLPQLKKLK